MSNGLCIKRLECGRKPVAESMSFTHTVWLSQASKNVDFRTLGLSPLAFVIGGTCQVSWCKVARQALGVWEAGRGEDDYVHACVCFMHNVTSAVALSRFCSICVQLPVTTSAQLVTRHPWPKAWCSFLHILAFMSSARQSNMCALSPSAHHPRMLQHRGPCLKV